MPRATLFRSRVTRQSDQFEEQSMELSGCDLVLRSFAVMSGAAF